MVHMLAQLQLVDATDLDAELQDPLLAAVVLAPTNVALNAVPLALRNNAPNMRAILL
jgi:hypothetical protein